MNNNINLIQKYQNPSDPLQIYLDSDVHKKYSKDLPSNEADPIGKLFVEGAFLGKPLELAGKYNWQNHNINLQQQPGPVYLIEQPSYKTIVKSKVFDLKIIDQNGKMKINWKKGASMFSTYSIPITIGEYIYDKNK